MCSNSNDSAFDSGVWVSLIPFDSPCATTTATSKIIFSSFYLYVKSAATRALDEAAVSEVLDCMKKDSIEPVNTGSMKSMNAFVLTL